MTCIYCICDNCIHNEVCVRTKQYDKIVGCQDFMDKTKIIELPCKIGQTIYVIDLRNYDCVNKDCFCCFNTTDLEEAFFSRKCEYVRHKPLIKKTKCNSVDSIIRWRKHFGTIAFLTVEEAETKVKELINNG